MKHDSQIPQKPKNLLKKKSLTCLVQLRTKTTFTATGKNTLQNLISRKRKQELKENRTLGSPQPTLIPQKDQTT